MSGIENRKELRIPATKLPKTYQSFSALLSKGLITNVITSDASLNGFGFTSSLASDNFIVGSHIALYPFGNDHPVYGIIVYSKVINEGTRVGLTLLHQGGYEKYCEVIKSIN